MMREIASWLERVGLAQYSEILAREAIDLDTLPTLTEQDLKELGLPLGHRRKLLRELAKLDLEGERRVGERNSQGGVAIANITLEPERRHITILFCDLVNSTGLSRRLDPEDLCDVISSYQKACTGPIEQYGGFIARFIGDGILAYFGYPLAHEDDAERGVRAGLGIVEAISRLNSASRGEPAGPLAVRIGISTGDVVVGYSVGKGSAEESAVAGEAANLAAKLQQLAKPNTLVVSSATKLLTAERFEFHDGGERKIGGFDRPVRCWTVIGEKAVSRFDSAVTSAAKLVGREQEIASLLQQWDSLAASRGSAALVRGRAGIGKSRLVATFRDHIRAGSRDDGSAPFVLNFSCSPFRRNTAFYPIIRQIARLAGLDAENTSAVNLEKLDRFLVKSGLKASPVETALFADFLSLQTPEGPSEFAVAAREKRVRTLEALQQLFRSLALRQPLLLIFEDIQWLDHTSGELLSRLVYWAANASVLILMTLRIDFLEMDHEANHNRLISHWLGLPHFTVCELDQLSEAETKQLINRAAMGKGLPASAIAAILQTAEGVPLYIEELTRALVESSSIGDTDPSHALKGTPKAVTIPNTLSGALMARLDQVGPGKLVAQHASVVGREFSAEFLASLGTMPEDLIREGLANLVRSDIVERGGPPGNDIYAFKHALIQEAAYRSMLRRRRKEIHFRIADQLVQRKKDDFEHLDDVIAQHYSRAGHWRDAIVWWKRAVAEAFARSAQVEAANLLEQALDAIGDQGAVEERQSLELDLTADLAAALRSSHGYAAHDVEERYLRARELSERTGEVSKRFNVEWGLMQCNLVKGDIETAYEIASNLLKYAADHRNRPVADAHLATGMVRLHLGNFAGARRALERGIELCNPAVDAPHFFTHGQNPGVFCRSYLAQALWFLGCADQAKSMIEENLGLARRRAAEAAHMYSYVNALAFAARIYSYRHDMAAVKHITEELIEISRRSHYAYYEALGVTQQGWAIASEQFDTLGIQQMREGLTALERTGTVLGLRGFYVQLAELYAQAGDRVAAQSMLDVSRHRMSSGSRMWDAEIERVRGLIVSLDPCHQGDEAEAAFLSSLGIARRQEARALELRTALSYARFLHGAKRTDEALQLLTASLGIVEEGMDTLDVIDARGILEQLAAVNRM